MLGAGLTQCRATDDRGDRPGPALKVGEAARFKPPPRRKTISAGGLARLQPRGKAVILAFYPADFSGGFYPEVCTLRDSFADLGKLNATVLGISGDYVFAHQEWRRSITFRSRWRHDHTVAKQYDSNAQYGLNKRTSVPDDKAGVIRYVNLDFKAGDKAGYDAVKAELRN
jgi:peroxiredoxin